MKKLIMVLVLAFSFAFSAASLVGNNATSYADGNDSPVACEGNKNTNPNADNVFSSVEGTDDEVSKDVGEGNIVTGVCIKSGNDAFDGKQHSEVITADGTYADCYVVTGIGTQEVTVTRVDDNDCKDISHIDVLFEKAGNGDDEDEEEEDEGQVLSDQVTVKPAGAVKAGGGGAASSAASLYGLFASVGTAGVGLSIRRFTK